MPEIPFVPEILRSSTADDITLKWNAILNASDPVLYLVESRFFIGQQLYGGGAWSPWIQVTQVCAFWLPDIQANYVYSMSWYGDMRCYLSLFIFSSFMLYLHQSIHICSLTFAAHQSTVLERFNQNWFSICKYL